MARKVTYLPKVVFLCSPSLAIIDSWLPILHGLRRANPGTEFIFLAPRAREIDAIQTDSLLFKLANELFDRVVFRSESGAWLESNSLEGAKIVRGQELDYRVRTSFRRFGLGSKASRYVTALLMAIQGVGKRASRSPKVCSLLSLHSERSVLLFDVDVVKKNWAPKLMPCFRSIRKFSLSHGLTVKLGNFDGPPLEAVKSVTDNTKVFVLSEIERKYHEQRYILPESAVDVVGVPRHEAEWVNFVQGINELEEPIPHQRYIFVASTPVNGAYLPRDRKLRALMDIRDVAEKHKLHVVVKRHPKEHFDGTFEEVFGERNLGVTWSLSNAHPFFLGKNAFFAVVFGGSVAVDMIRLGTPVIGILDLANLPAYDTPEALRNSRGEPVFAPSFLGLLLGASNREQFNEHVESIMRDREGCVSRLMDNYISVYPDPKGSNKKIVSEISLVLQRKKGGEAGLL